MKIELDSQKAAKLEKKKALEEEDKQYDLAQKAHLKLLEERAKLRIYDPQVKKETILSALGLLANDDRITFCKSAIDATSGTHAVALLTEWEEFKSLNFNEIYSQMEKPAYFFDGRNLIEPKIIKDAGFRLYRIGKK